MSNTALLGSYGGQGNSSLMFRNRIINGDMRIDQRNAGASVATISGAVYTVDRWQALCSQAAKFTVQQNAGSVTPPTGFTNYLGITSSSVYSVGINEVFHIRQQIEGFNTADFGWGTAGAQSVSLSFWVRSSLTGTFGGALQNSAGNRSYPFSYSISAANTWEYKTITIAGDTAGTWATNNTTGVAVIFSMGNGSGVSGASGAWLGTNTTSVTGATSLVGTNGATFYITGVQLEAETATPFERRPYSVELGMAMRYYQKLQPTHTAYFNSGTDVLGTLPYLVPTRAPAGVSFLGSVANVSINRAGNSGVPVSSFTSAVDVGAVSAQLRYALATAGTTGQGTLVSFGGDAYVQINAEL